MNQGEIATTIIGALTLFATIIAAIKGIVWLLNFYRQVRSTELVSFPSSLLERSEASLRPYETPVYLT